MARRESYVFVLVGAGGAVGREMLGILEERKFPVAQLRPAGSDRSAGSRVEFSGREVAIEKVAAGLFEGADIAFFTAGAGVSREFVPVAAGAGALVVDNTSAFRLEPDVPLAVPEVNPETLERLPDRRIVSVPNCTTVQLVVAVAPLHRAARVRRIVLSSYQSTSGAGRRAMEELSRQVRDLFGSREAAAEVFPHRIAFNVIPQIGAFDREGSSSEESKIVAETKKILGDGSIGVSVTAARVPTFHGHAASVNVETEEPLGAEEARALLEAAPGVRVVDDPPSASYPMPADAAGADEVFVGRIRNDPSRPNCLNLWVVADNLRKGAALNGVQILEHLRGRDLL